jgi:peptidylprolyl isomerase
MDPENTLIMTLESGAVTIKLRPDLAPGHVTRIKELAREGFYDGIVFHRVIPGFMAQGGDPSGTGSGGSKKPNLQAEFSREPHVRGVCSMARTPNPNSANSQFFICYQGCGGLTGQYTVWGEVVSGMDAVNKIKKGSSSDNGKVTGPDKIVRMQLMADAR